jgi:asparagine synthase (glutamine-hydrolysing)
MCGIVGFIDFNSRSSKEILIKMSDQIVRRGPDDSGYEFFKQDKYNIGFGFRRLSIIDLSPAGHQPMFDASGDYCIIFNGEVYNYKEIREVLLKDGFVFKSGTDTEVVLNSFIKWGASCIERFNGMFAFSIFDKRNEKVYLFRDRVGVKPLFYYYSDNLFLFGSELKGIRAHPEFNAALSSEGVDSFLRNGYVGGTNCIYQNTCKLEAGSYAEFNLLTKELKLIKYWDVNSAYNLPKSTLSYSETKLKLEELLISAFNYRMVSDVPVGVFLSGGYDSTCVAAILQATNNTKIKTFTIGFNDSEYDESQHAKNVAKHIGTDHYEFFCTEKQAIEIIPQLSEIYDEPFADPSAIPTTLLSEMSRKHITVALSADGGDELFAGYPRHSKFMKVEKLRNMIPDFASILFSKLISDRPSALSIPNRNGKLKSLLKSAESVERFISLNETFTSSELSLLESKTNFKEKKEKLNLHKDPLDSILSYEYSHYLVDDIMQKVDRATMYHSLEGREPFLDYRIVEFVATLPNSYKMGADGQKLILKDIVHKYVPKEIMDRPKMGFGIPLSKWFKNDLRQLLDETCSKENIERTGVLNYSVVNRIISDFKSDRIQDFQRLYTIFILQNWLNRWM